MYVKLTEIKHDVQIKEVPTTYTQMRLSYTIFNWEQKRSGYLNSYNESLSSSQSLSNKMMNFSTLLFTTDSLSMHSLPFGLFHLSHNGFQSSSVIRVILSSQVNVLLDCKLCNFSFFFKMVCLKSKYFVALTVKKLTEQINVLPATEENHKNSLMLAEKC
jgi:hypothetical protein